MIVILSIINKHGRVVRLKREKFNFLGRDGDRLVPGGRGKISHAALIKSLAGIIYLPRLGFKPGT